MGRTYSGILGPLAFLTVVARGLIHGSTATSTLYWAWLAFVVFAAVGYLIGQIAASVVEDSVRASLAAELAAREVRTAAVTAEPSETTRN